ncbi:MAG: thioredoxin domain-containing protein [Candidatus Dormibacteria bacterium]
MSAPALRLAVDTSTFAREVLERSHTVPVVVDFWASWCGPCKQLGPTLEAATDAMGGAVLLRTVDVDSNQELAQRYQVRGIPAVKAFRDGNVVSEFVGAQPASAVKTFLNRLLPSPADQLVEIGDEESLQQALSLDPSHLPARRALARVLLQQGRFAEAADLARQAPQDRICDGLAAWAVLAQEPDRHTIEVSLLEALGSDNPVLVVELGIALIPMQQRERRDLVRRIILYAFEQLGPDHPAAVEGRSQLAAALY